jgi:hypothetical protein
MEPPRNNMFPCSLREHNAQAPEKAPIPGDRNRVFPKGEGNMRCWLRSTLLRNRQNIQFCRSSGF